MERIRGLAWWLCAAIASAALLGGCGGKSYEEVLQAIRSSSADDAAKALAEADLSQEERLAIDALCTTADSYSDTGTSPTVFDWRGVYKRTFNPTTFGVYTERADRLSAALDLYSVNPGAAGRYVQFCIAR